MSLRIYPITVELTHDVAEVLPRIAAADPNLAKQLRNAVTSVPLNTSEGMYSLGRNRIVRYHTAMGSAREVIACLEVAHAMGIAPQMAPELRAKLDRIIGTLFRIVRPRPS